MVKMNSYIENNTDIVFEELAKELDITSTLFKNAENRYKSLASFLGEDNSNLSKLGVEIEIYLQGSAKLGTVTKPIEETDDYDIDAVCVLKNIAKSNATQEQVKEAFGKDIKAYAEGYGMKRAPKNGKRCWTLYYYDDANFHIDFLPAIPDANNFGIILESQGYSKAAHIDTTLAITDKRSPVYSVISDDWYISNPLGYFEWFKEKMKERYKFQKSVIAKRLNIDIEEVPEYRIKTSLQKAIQILKRHRNIYFKDDEYGVASVIITTLAAQAYNGNSSLAKTLMHLTTTMANYISVSDKGYQVTNPVNPMENFAEKWNSNRKYANAFNSWIIDVKKDIENIIKQTDNIFESSEFEEAYQEKFGKKAFKTAFGKSLKRYENKSGKKAGIIAVSTAIPKISKPYGSDEDKKNKKK